MIEDEGGKFRRLLPIDRNVDLPVGLDDLGQSLTTGGRQNAGSLWFNLGLEIVQQRLEPLLRGKTVDLRLLKKGPGDIVVARRCQLVGEIHPVATADAGCRSDQINDVVGNATHDRQHVRQIALVKRHGRHDGIARKAHLQLLGKARLFNIAQIATLVVFLTLGNHQLLVGEITYDRFNGQPDFRHRTQAAMTKGHLIAARAIGVRTHQNWNLLALLSNGLHQPGIGLA